MELLCQAILATPREGGKNGGKIQDTVGELLGATILTRFNPSLTWLPITRLLSTGYKGRNPQVALQTR